VIAAGGIASAAGVAAAMRLGAAGVQVGSAYLLCPEARTSAVHRRALANPAGAATSVTNLFTGRPARGIINRLMRELGPMNCATPQFPLAASTLAPLRAHLEGLGSGDFSPLWAGENTRGLRARPAAEVTGELMRAFAAT
jgi:nitronate monooxygenase